MAKPQKYQVNSEEFKELEAMGYRVHMFQPWHYRVAGYFNGFMLDIFPTRKTYVKKYPDYVTNKQDYDDLIELVERELDFFNKFLVKKFKK